MMEIVNRADDLDATGYFELRAYVIHPFAHNTYFDIDLGYDVLNKPHDSIAVSIKVSSHEKCKGL